MQRIKEFDGLRGLAALVIVAYHVWPNWLSFGWAAVDLFFVLSGYLITLICLENDHREQFLFNFYIRRGLRIWPIYYLLILILIILGDDNTKAVPYYLVYVQEVPRYWNGSMPLWRDMQHAWTLAVEEQFYLLWPGLIMVADRRLLRIILTVFLVSALFARFIGVPQRILLTSGDGLALGSLLALLQSEAEASARTRMIGRYSLAAACVSVILLAFRIAIRRSPWISDWPHVAPLAASLASFAVVAHVSIQSGQASLSFLRHPLLVYLGTISYGLYLYHLPLLHYIRKIVPARGSGAGFGGVAVFVASILLATVSWYLIERPILSLKGKFTYRRASHGASLRHECTPRPDPSTAGKAVPSPLSSGP